MGDGGFYTTVIVGTSRCFPGLKCPGPDADPISSSGAEVRYERGNISTSPYTLCGPGSVVGIATGYRLDGPWIESRWGARFSAPVQTDPGAHPTSCTMGTGSFPGIKSGRGVTLTPHRLLVSWL